jgi:hypothetical protein
VRLWWFANLTMTNGGLHGHSAPLQVGLATTHQLPRSTSERWPILRAVKWHLLKSAIRPLKNNDLHACIPSQPERRNLRRFGASFVVCRQYSLDVLVIRFSTSHAVGALDRLAFTCYPRAGSFCDSIINTASESSSHGTRWCAGEVRALSWS